MHIWTPLVVIVLLALLPARAVDAQIADPLPMSIDKRGLMVEIRDVVRLPKTLGLLHADQDVDPAGWARVSFVRDAPDGRRFANDDLGGGASRTPGTVRTPFLCGGDATP